MARSAPGSVTVMVGTLINVAAIVLGAALGVALGGRLPERVRGTITDVLGLFVVVLGISDALRSFGPELSGALGRASVLVILGSLLVGGIVGELLRIESALERLGTRLRDRVLGRAAPATVPATATTGGGAATHPDRNDPRHRFVEGFVTTSLIVCVGPLAVLGALQDGLSGDYQLLAVKSMLDGSIAIAFASVFGIGVAFSVLPLLVWQGGLSLLASAAGAGVSDPMVAGLTATGGFLVIGIGLRLLDLRPIRVANLLPALVIAPLVIWLWP